MCAKCGRKGHSANSCHNPKGLSGIVIFTIKRINETPTPLPKVTVKVGSIPVSADTGVQVTAAGIGFLQKFRLKQNQLKKLPNVLRHAGGGGIYL